MLKKYVQLIDNIRDIDKQDNEAVQQHDQQLGSDVRAQCHLFSQQNRPVAYLKLWYIVK